MTQPQIPSAAQIVANYLRDIGAGVDEFSHYEDELVAQIDAFAASERAELLAALRDCASGLQYVRDHYHDERMANGDLYGVGFDRALNAARAALAVVTIKCFHYAVTPPYRMKCEPCLVAGYCLHKHPASTQTDYLGKTPRGFRTVVVGENDDGEDITVSREPIY